MFQKLKENYEMQIFYYNELEKITQYAHLEGTDVIIESLHLCQPVINKLEELSAEQSRIRQSLIRSESEKKGINVALEAIITGQEREELLSLKQELKEVIAKVIENKNRNMQILSSELENAKKMINRTKSETRAVNSYMSKKYDSVFIDKIQK